MVRYDEANYCRMGVTARRTDPELVDGLWISRPCSDPRLWQSLLVLARMGPSFLWWPNSPPVVVDVEAGAAIGEDILTTMGKPRLVQSVDDVIRLLEQT